MTPLCPVKRRRDDSPSSNKETKKSRVFSPQSEDLRQTLGSTLESIFESKLPKSFRIHLTAIKNKLSTGKYSDARDFVEDVWSEFENVRLSNPKSEHYAELADTFELEIDAVMKSLGYCCGKNYRFDPPRLCCSLKDGCTITIGAHYFSYQTRYNICENCFTNIPGDTVDLAEQSSSLAPVRKNQFTKVENNVTTPEPLIKCEDCGRRQHTICVLYSNRIWRNGFVCDSCLAMNGLRRAENPFSAKNLPVTKLDVHIEARVNNLLKVNKYDGGRVHIRMLLNTDQQVTVKPAMHKLFVESGEMSATFPYRSKAIFAFQEIDGVDVSFFGMYVQEYGSECPDPNKRRVYVEFLDSVNFFQQKSLRTAIYHEIFLGYMEFAKQLGYTWIHIWACPPPPRGESYIFYSHPADQKVPDSLRLQRWYEKILLKGKREHIVVDHMTYLQQYTDVDASQQTKKSLKTKRENIAIATRLPYFDEDYWIYFFEDTIQKMAVKSTATASSRTEEQRNRKTKQPNHSRNWQKNRLGAEIFHSMQKLSEHFFAVQLHSAESSATLDPIRDPDGLIENGIIKGHSAFFDFSRDNNYEFSSLRRAQFSTMCILYELHNQEHSIDHYACDICKLQVQTWYHCTVCEDYDLCANCNEKTGHDHDMEKMGLTTSAVADEALPNNLQTNAIGPDNETPPITSSVDFHFQLADQFPAITTHAYKCSDRNCRIPSCQMMKCFASHLLSCQKNGNCHICKTLNTLLSNHLDSCRNPNCSFSFCKSTKAEIQREQQQEREMQLKDSMINMAATLEKISLKILDNGESWTDQRFMLSIGFDLANTQSKFQEILAENYAAQLHNIGTISSSAQNQSANPPSN